MFIFHSINLYIIIECKDYLNFLFFNTNVHLLSSEGDLFMTKWAGCVLAIFCFCVIIVGYLIVPSVHKSC